MCEDCYKKYVEDKDENEKCPFCDIEKKFRTTFFDMGEGEKECSAWIDYESKDPEDFLWYAVLAGSPYTWGHTLVILGCHMDQITENIDESDGRKAKLEAMMMGINRLSHKLKSKLDDVEAVHALCLCEGEKTHHLHFHLIPRYKYKLDEKRFFGYFYKQRAKKMNNVKRFEDDFKKGNIHGFWHDAYKEMHFVDTDFNKLPLEQRREELENLAKDLRSKKLPKKFAI